MESKTTGVNNRFAFSEDDAKEVLEESCAGGICSLGSKPESGTGDVMGKVISAKPMFVKTPIRTLPRQADAKEIYSYIKNNSLQTVAKETAMKEIKERFANSDRDIEKIFEDAILSSKSTDVDFSYGYATDPVRDIEINEKINEGYDQLKKLGIV